MEQFNVSYDCRKVLEVLEIEEEYYFDIEVALAKAYPKNIIAQAKKTNIRTALAMAQKGFFKGVPERTDVVFSEQMRKTYNFVCKVFLDKDFPYGDLSAIEKLSEYSLTQIYNAMSVKNLWYLLKVLQSQNNSNNGILVNDLELNKEMGEKFDLSQMGEIDG